MEPYVPRDGVPDEQRPPDLGGGDNWGDDVASAADVAGDG